MPTIPALDGLRGCAFLIVFLGHAVPLRYSIYLPATFGVMLFFFLSGYLITSILRVEGMQRGTISLGGFYRRRLMRILPPLYIVFAACLLLTRAGVLWAPVNGLGIASSLLFFYNYAQISSDWVLIPVGMTLLWSLAVEEHFYLVFPGLYRWMLRRGMDGRRQARLLFRICVAVALWRCYVILVWHPMPHQGLGWNYAATDTRLDSLLFGAILALRNNPICGESFAWVDRRPLAAAAAGVLLILLSMVNRDLLLRDLYRFNLQGAGLYLLFYLLLTWQQSAWVRWLAWRPLRWIGWLSYTLYLVHHTVIQALERYHPGNWPLNLVLSLVLSLAFAQLMRMLVEQPLRRWRIRRSVQAAEGATQ